MNSKPRLLLFVLSVILVCILACNLGCARKPTDAQISSQIQSKFSQDSGLGTKQLTVQANDGVVTLSGIVDDEAQRQAASRQAASVAGVREVVNNLQVGSGANASVNSAVSSQRPVVESAEAQPVPFNRAENKTAEHDAARKRRERANGDHSQADRSQSNSSQSNRSQSNRSQSDQSQSAESVSANNTSSPSATLAQNADSAPTSVQPAPAVIAPVSAPPPEQPRQPRRVTIEQGTQMTIRLVDSIDSEKNQIGDTFHATLNAPLAAEGMEAIPAGADVAGHIVDLKSAGKFAGQSLVILQLDSISASGRSYSLQTDQYRKEGNSRGKNTAEKVGGGALIGGIIGAIAGGGKGAAIGTAAGAGVGGGAQAASKKQAIKLPSETILNFTLQAPLTVAKPTDRTVERPKLGDSQ